MDQFNQRDLHELLDDPPSPCVSLLMPTTRGVRFADARQFKNLLRTACQQCQMLETQYPNAVELLKPLQLLGDDEDYWKDASNGLAVFAAPGMTRTYRLPLPLPDKVVVAPRFHLKPLASFLVDDAAVYVLALSQKQVRLLRVHRQCVESILLPPDASNFGAAMRYDDIELSRTVHSHPAAGGPPKAQEAIAHGHGVGIDSSKDGIQEFCLHIRREVENRLHDAREPLLLAGTEPLVSIYRSVNRYRNLMSESLAGCPDYCSDSDLAERARSVLEFKKNNKLAQSVAFYQQLAGTGRTMNEVGEIIAASVHGSVQHLFFRTDIDIWGAFPFSPAEPEIHGRCNAGDEDLINYTMIHVLRHGGEIYPCRRSEAPTEHPMSAISWLPIGERRRKRVV